MLFCLGGITEILGYWDYNGCDSKAGDRLLTIANAADVSAGGVWQQNFCNPWVGYDEMVSETRNGTSKILYASAGTGRTVSAAGSNIALFTAYDSAMVQTALLSGIRGSTPVGAKNGLRLWVTRTKAGIEATYGALRPEPVTLLMYDLSGRIVRIVKERSGHTGIRRTLIPRGDCSAGFACIEIRQGGESEIVRLNVE
jgi:hypothetical protein